jgi:hypothetical protein
VRYEKGEPARRKCKVCACRQNITRLNKKRIGISWSEDRKINWRAENNPAWNGGRYRHQDGYVMVKIQPDDAYFPMADKKGMVLEHRLVMAKSLGRCLTRQEHVHHLNDMRDDNCRENLELISQRNHNLRTTFCSNCELKKEIRLLRFQQKVLLEQIRGLSVHLNFTNEVQP